MPSPILWHNDEQSVYLIDIPRSIETAQGETTQDLRHLVSSLPLQSPFGSNEPKSALAKAKVEGNSVITDLHAIYQDLLSNAGDKVRKNYDGPWCLPRPFTEDAPRTTKKRKLHEDSSEPPLAASSQYKLERSRSALPGALLSSLARSDKHDAYSVSSDDLDRGEGNGKANRFFSNASDRSSSLHITRSDQDESFAFRIPPHASFYLGDCADSNPFRAAVRTQAQQLNTRASFDFILLDPPWPNSSVKRTHQTPGSTYSTSASIADMRELLLDTKVDFLMAEDCLIGVWITNKPTIRDLVLGEDGIFECWDVEPVEEWIWLKTTVHGEPVSALDALWRKPYEALLLGRMRSLSNRQEHSTDPSKVKRKVIISVPDMHSRKPCLKELIEPLMPDPKNYRALELFARYLVTGWCSWGDECIKYNYEGFWRDMDKRYTEAGT
ncbi:hypothetical protein LTR37_012138 [Vermiconidia calcicola]|uniref:Uncharacterized protein n=1 Tax=Vermiconidia calcicola TaxID=1690605 RepID=A0ACC3N1E5_9PEZI|nr:hypothetical protein LTR37_012138 [Vermiconidia calcicola]